MSRALLKFNGGSVHDYATIADDSPRPKPRVTRPEGGDERRHILTSFDPAEPLRGFEHAGGHPPQHHRPTAPAFYIALHMARAAEQTLDGVRGGERSLEAFRQAQAEHGQRLVEAFSDARGRTRLVGVQAASQVLQQSFRRP